MSGLEAPSTQAGLASAFLFKPFHFVDELLQAGLELCADSVGLITTCCAAAPHVRPLLRQRLGMLQEEAGHHLQTQKHTEKHRTGKGKWNRFSTTSLCWK